MQAQRNVSTARAGQLFSLHAQWTVVKTLEDLLMAGSQPLPFPQIS